MSSVIQISDAGFETELAQATQPVLVYFWASWCGPCRLVAPTINWVAENYGDRLKVLKLEIDPNPITVRQYKVAGVPAFRLIKGKDVLLSYEGAITQQKLVSLLDPYL